MLEKNVLMCDSFAKYGSDRIENTFQQPLIFRYDLRGALQLLLKFEFPAVGGDQLIGKIHLQCIIIVGGYR